MERGRFDICKMTLFYVDDDDYTSKIVNGKLSKNYPMQKLIFAKNVFDAISKIKENQPDIFIIDLHVPMPQGFVLINEIVKQRKMNQVAVLSVCKDKHVIEKCTEFGLKHYIAKPIDFNVLFDKIDSLMENVFITRLAEAKGNPRERKYT